MTADGEVISAEQLAILADDVRLRNLGLILGLDDDELAKTCGIVGLDTIGDTFDDTFELDATGHLRDDDSVEGVPLGDDVALGNLLA